MPKPLFVRLARRRSNTTGSRTAPPPFLNDSQWFLIADLFPHPPITSAGGRPRIDPRACLEGIIWVLYTGARWQDLPDWAPSESTCRRRLREWTESGLLTEVWARLVELTDELGEIDWEHLIADGTFCRAKKGGNSWDAAARETVPPSWSLWTASELPSAC